jgi:hypothetical protein
MYFTEACEINQYSDGEQAYWMMNGKRMRYLNRLDQLANGEEIILPMSTQNGVNTKYAIEMQLSRKVKVRGVVLDPEVNNSYMGVDVDHTASYCIMLLCCVST